MKPPRYSIGDVEPLPPGTNIEMAKAAQAKRGLLVRNAKSSRCQAGHAARKILAGMAENERRTTDPIERAKTWLRRKGFMPVYEDRGTFVVGRQRIEGWRAFLAFAEGKGWAK